MKNKKVFKLVSFIATVCIMLNLFAVISFADDEDLGVIVNVSLANQGKLIACYSGIYVEDTDSDDFKSYGTYNAESTAQIIIALSALGINPDSDSSFLMGKGSYYLLDYPFVQETTTAEKCDFAVLCGVTGSVKTTLLRLLKPSLSPKGNMQGEILFNNESIVDAECFNESEIGFVMQNPEQQIVTDKDWHELAFALENRNLP